MKTVRAVEDLTEEELETLLTGRRLSREQQLLSEGKQSDARAVQASETDTHAVGPTPKLDFTIEGVSVTAMVDTGAQSNMLYMRQQGLPVPTLEKPSV